MLSKDNTAFGNIFPLNGGEIQEGVGDSCPLTDKG